jgi:hypothetical protein
MLAVFATNLGIGVSNLEGVCAGSKKASVWRSTVMGIECLKCFGALFFATIAAFSSLKISRKRPLDKSNCLE